MTWFRNRSVAAVIASIALFSAVTSTHAVTIYVDLANAGSPTMDGSAGDPWDTIQKGVDDINNNAFERP